MNNKVTGTKYYAIRRADSKNLLTAYDDARGPSWGLVSQPVLYHTLREATREVQRVMVYLSVNHHNLTFDDVGQYEVIELDVEIRWTVGQVVA